MSQKLFWSGKNNTRATRYCVVSSIGKLLLILDIGIHLCVFTRFWQNWNSTKEYSSVSSWKRSCFASLQCALLCMYTHCECALLICAFWPNLFRKKFHVLFKSWFHDSCFNKSRIKIYFDFSFCKFWFSNRKYVWGDQNKQQIRWSKITLLRPYIWICAIDDFRWTLKHGKNLLKPFLQ